MSNNLTNVQKLKLWRDVETSLLTVPVELRTLKHKMYLQEVEGAIQELKWIIDHE